MGQDGLHTDEDGVTRCAWCASDPLYIQYHDQEWGFPMHDDGRLFEKICLEGFQSGLSWLTILRKRENFRNAFCNFNFERVARMGKRDVNRLLKDAGIVRHRGKIESTINNAQRARELIAEFGSLDAFFWSFEPQAESRPRQFDWQALKARSTSSESIALSKNLKKRGWSFVGPTTMYAFMQAVGLVNDHLSGCRTRPLVEKARKASSARVAKRP